MTKKPTSTDELQEYVSSHADSGKIGGEQIIQDNAVEVQGYVTADLYNRALLRSAPWGYDKSRIASTGVLLLLKSSIAQAKIPLQFATYRKGDDDTRLFRGYMSQSSHNLLHKYTSAAKLNSSQVATLLLVHFAYDPNIEEVYQEFLRDLRERMNVSDEDIENTIYGHFKIKARVKRLNLKLAGDPDAESEKLP